MSIPYQIVHNLELYRGDYCSWQHVFWQDEPDGIESDLTGAEANAQIRDKPLPNGVSLVTLEAVITLPNIVTVTINGNLWYDEEALWPSKKGFWDLQLDWGSGQVYTFVRGDVVITQDITKVVEDP